MSNLSFLFSLVCPPVRFYYARSFIALTQTRCIDRIVFHWVYFGKITVAFQMTNKNDGDENFRLIYCYCYDTFSDLETRTRRIQMFSVVVCGYKVKNITPSLFSTAFVYDFSRRPGSTRVQSFVVKKKTKNTFSLSFTRGGGPPLLRSRCPTTVIKSHRTFGKQTRAFLSQGLSFVENFSDECVVYTGL